MLYADAMPADALTPRRLTCARCSAAFDCGLSGACWCQAEPYKLPADKTAGEDCLCPDCLRKAAAALALR